MVIEVIHTNGLSDIINHARIDGVAESKNCEYSAVNIGFTLNPPKNATFKCVEK